MNKFISGIMLLVMLAVFSAPAMANYNFDGFPLQPRVSGTINGETFSDYVAWDGSTDITLTTTVPSGTIKYAYLYTGTWCGTEQNAGWVNVTFNGNGAGVFDDDGNELGPIYIAGENDVNPNVWCSGHGKSWWYYNVTSLVIPGAINTVRNKNIDVPYGNVYGVALVVVLEDGSKPLIQYWINDGSEGLNSGNSNGATDFSGVVDQPNVAKSALTGIVLTGYSPSCQNCMKFNNHPMYTGHITSNTLWMGTWDETNSVVTPANVTGGTPANNFWYDRGQDGYVNICLGLLELQLTDATLPDLEPTDIEFPKVMRPGKSHTIDATIVNQGCACGSFDVSLYVDDVPKGTVTVTGGLAASGSTTVSFPNVNLLKGCYTFKVVADSDGDIVESEEGNNETSEDYQVGYIIVVESDAEFEELNVTGAYALPSGCFVNDGGTYYIQDLTGSYSVENCDLSCNDGDGITIKGTTATFVIRDCTIKNCANSGVFLHDLVNGTVEDCTVQDNIRYGIEVGEVPLNSDDPKFVSISNNELYDNLYGIELVANESTVTCNTVRDNREDGIYVFGNDNNICNNVIENSTDYGMKVYDSTGNRIYWNNFTNNNGGGVQGYDNKATNTWNQVNKNYPYNGAIYTNYTGNYWDDHTAPDSNGDGIVDSPSYALDGSAGAEDSYPLVTLPWTFDIPIYKNNNDPKNLFSVPLVASTLADVIDDPKDGDTVFRYYNGVGYKSASYYYGTWWDADKVEPIEPGVAYQYDRVGGGAFIITNNGTFMDGVNTTIYGEASTGDPKNLIGYASFNNTTLSSAFGGHAEDGDTVFRYVNGVGYKSASYYYGTWWDADKVDPIEPGVGYEYMRYDVTFYWTYNP
jgi:parallel beta-helix repeat protein